MKKVLFIIAGLLLVAGAIMAHYWTTTQPIAVIEPALHPGTETDSSKLPETNRKILSFVEEHGKDISPTYDSAVCTEFVIRVMEYINPLSKQERKLIRIITDKNLVELIEMEDDIIKGLQTALLYKNKGKAVIRAEDVLPGDFVQFWSVYGNFASGHCGVIRTIKPGVSFTVYSSHPLTNGYGIQEFLWPDKIYFARLK